jgi:hypothetical protein
VVRKLVLVGIILVFGRGSVLQLGVALFIATLFMTAHVKVEPYKLPLDNLLRFTTELHTVITIMIALTIKADTAVRSRQSVYDHVLVDTFVGLVVIPFAAVAVAKVRTVHKLMKQAPEEPTTQQKTTGGVHMAFERIRLGLESATDRELISTYFAFVDKATASESGPKNDETLVPTRP